MAWEDVPAKLAAYDAEEYAPARASENLARFFTDGRSDDYNDVPEHRRGEFEAALDYRLGACRNVAASRAWRP